MRSEGCAGGRCRCGGHGAHTEGTLACVLVQRLAARHAASGWRLSQVNAHRVYLAALLVAAKLLRDVVNRRALAVFARRGGVSTRELCRLELTFLFASGFALFVDGDSFSCFCETNCCSILALLYDSPTAAATSGGSAEKTEVSEGKARGPLETAESDGEVSPTLTKSPHSDEVSK
eukprot:TRINITY_DN11405_c0_g1_i2.p2 TRINITY_DN11405_c0_g1~~TRINITY_DN11405_c0_g1_i2.p2  ORF type:complete len:176 (-),score=48.40 TRINITY_DN11405_c0_g1_i2:98-625(-)